MIGDRLQDKYSITKKVGKGGFATVYRGFDESLERPVAIKFLESAEESSRVKDRFLREAHPDPASETVGISLSVI